MAKKTTSRKAAGLSGMTASAKYRQAVDKAARSPIGAPVWKPTKDGDAVAGRIVSHAWREGRDKPYCTILLDNGEQSVRVSLWTVLLMTFAEQAVRVGAELAIVYRGEGDSGHGAGRPPKLFGVELVKNGEGELIVTPEQAEGAKRKRRGRKSGRKGGRARA